jgi:ATP-binding cassette subfamily B protein
MLKRFASYYKPHMKLFILDMIAAFIVSCADLFYPRIAQHIINDYVPNKNLQMLLIWSGALLLIYIIKMLLSFFMQYQGHMVGVGIQADMRREAFQRLQKLPFKYFDENKTGSILSRLVNDTFEIAELAHHGPEDLFLSVITLIGAFIMMAQINLLLTVILFAVVPLIVWFAVLLRRQLSATSTKCREEIAEVNATIENSIAGIRISRSYVSSDRELEKFDENNVRYVKARDANYKVMGKFFSGMGLFTDLLYLMVLFFGGLFFFYGKINVGEFTAYILYINMFLNPIKKLVNIFEQLQNGMTGFKRVTAILDEPIEEEKPDAQDLTDVKGSIDFEDVSFSYEASDDDKDHTIINHLSMHLDPGKTVALVGPSGSGKTTLCHLIPRFYEITSGAIRIDGNDIRDLTRLSLRQNIGMVAQDVFLFTGTIRDNIAYGSQDATDEQIIDAAKKANIHDYIMTLPDGYDTYIGERGVKLSGGQKQRVSIARVFLKNPSILILDEATSALDNATEMLIQSSLEQLAKGRTSIIVAHRLSTIKNADEIIVLTEEGIKERGTHEELLALNGIYADLYQYQFRE